MNLVFNHESCLTCDFTSVSFLFYSSSTRLRVVKTSAEKRPMSRDSSPITSISSHEQKEVDVIVIGAGFAGVYMLYKLRKRGLDVRLFEAGNDVGGTWYWNCYPGARCDVQSIECCYCFSPEAVGEEWTWTERYARQPEIQRYIQFIANRFNLRPHISFKTSVRSMVYNDTRNQWFVITNTGDTVAARFCILATGCLSVPEISGLEKFAGKVYHPGRWPHGPVDFTGQRVGILGTGSSCLQLIPELAQQAGDLFIFQQRTPNHAVPNTHPFTKSFSQRVQQRSDELWKKWLSWPSLNASSSSTSERDVVYEYQWSKGGIEFLYSFDDLVMDQAANDTAAKLVRLKVRGIVQDPTVAEHLVPAQHPLGSKRLCLQSGSCLEALNRPNVHLVSAQVIEEIDRNGVRTSKESYPLDSLIIATGYDDVTGPVMAIDIRGRSGRSLRDLRADMAGAYLDFAMQGFPNLFLITASGSPSVISGKVRSVEQHLDWIGDCLTHTRKRGVGLGDFPEYFIAQILSMTTPRDVARMACVNRSFRVASCSDMVWQKLNPNSDVYGHAPDAPPSFF